MQNLHPESRFEAKTALFDNCLTAQPGMSETQTCEIRLFFIAALSEAAWQGGFPLGGVLPCAVCVTGMPWRLQEKDLSEAGTVDRGQSMAS